MNTFINIVRKHVLSLKTAIAVSVIITSSCTHKEYPALSDSEGKNKTDDTYWYYKSTSIPQPYSSYYLSHPRKQSKQKK